MRIFKLQPTWKRNFFKKLSNVVVRTKYSVFCVESQSVFYVLDFKKVRIVDQDIIEDSNGIFWKCGDRISIKRKFTANKFKYDGINPIVNQIKFASDIISLYKVKEINELSLDKVLDNLGKFYKNIE